MAIKVTVTNEQGEIYSQLTAEKDERDRWWLTDEDGDVLSPAEIFSMAETWANGGRDG